MEPIIKTIEREIVGSKVSKRIKPSFIQSDLLGTPLNVFSFFIIFGIETYYRNIIGEPGVIHLTGFWTWVIGILLLIVFSKSRASANRFRKWAEKNGGKITEIITISDSHIGYQILGYSSVSLHWNSLTSYKSNKKYLEIFIGGIEIRIPATLFTNDELQNIVTLLNRRLIEETVSIPPPLPTK